MSAEFFNSINNKINTNNVNNYFLQNIIIDIILQGSIILYYFFNIKHFVIINIIKFIPILMCIYLFVTCVALLVLLAIKDKIERKEEQRYLELKKELSCPKFQKLYHKITSISLLILLVLTGHYISFILFLLSLHNAQIIKQELGV